MKTLLFLLIIPSCFQKQPLPKRYDIFLCVGQSNMLGNATIETQDSGSTAWLWNDTDWEIADGHLNRYSNIANVYGGLSMVNSFGKEAATNNRKQVGLVVNARGGTMMQQWTSLYMLASIQRALDALGNNPGSRIAGIMWHQGESDMFDAHAWMTGFKVIRHQVDSLLGYDVPIFVGGLSTVHYYYRVLNDTMRQVELIHDCYFVSSDSLTTTDGTHFDAKSQRIFGLRYWDECKASLQSH